MRISHALAGATILAGCAALFSACSPATSEPQQAAAAPAPDAAPTPVSSAVENPTYISIPMEITINKPVDEVWKRIGKYCDISEWLQIPAGCTITAGTDGEVGAVRTVGKEILVGKTEYSYTYTQPVRDGRAYNLYHGTLEARPLTPKTTKMLYTLIYDNSLIPGDAAAKQAEIARRRTAFERGLSNMKILCEGGTLPPPPPRPAPAKK